MSKLYVGNLSYTASEEELTDLFASHGNVVSVKIITDRDSGRPKGFGFVEMGSPEEAQAAIEKLNSYEFKGRPLKVNEANERPPRTGGGGGGPRRHSGGGNGGGRRDRNFNR